MKKKILNFLFYYMYKLQPRKLMVITMYIWNRFSSFFLNKLLGAFLTVIRREFPFENMVKNPSVKKISAGKRLNKTSKFL